MAIMIEKKQDLIQLHQQALELDHLIKEFERQYYYTTGTFYPFNPLSQSAF